MYHPTTRVLTVLELLQSHQYLSGPELAARLEVDARTVRRYITMLQDMGIPIESERGRHGYYRLRAGFKLPPLMFSEDEALALTLGLLAARRIGLGSTAPSIEGALAKIERVLPEGLRSRIQALQEALAIDTAGIESAPLAPLVGLFGASAGQGQSIWMRYCSAQGDATERVLDPYGLVYRAGYWYAVGYCHLRQNMRTFRLDRVLAAEPQTGWFTRPTGFDALKFVIDSIASLPGSWCIEIILHTELETAERVVPATLGRPEQTAEGVVLRCTIEDLDWMARFLVELNLPLTVLGPEELRKALRRLAAEVSAMAG